MKEYSSTNRCLRKETTKKKNTASLFSSEHFHLFSRILYMNLTRVCASIWNAECSRWRFQISDLKQISQNAEMIISTCALFVEHAYKMISLYLPKPSCNIPFFSLGPYEFFGRIITASCFITSDTKEICNTNEDYSSYEFFPLSSRAQGIFNTGIRSGKILYLCERWVESTQMRSPLMTIGNTKATMLGWIIE